VNLSAPFVRRPIGTTLLTIGVALAGIAAFFVMPVSPLPQVDFPTIAVQASLPGASPETMASSVATPLERRLGHIADVTEMTSSSGTGSSRITLQFGLDRDIDGAARDVQAAINAARTDLPATLRSNPTYRKVNPADAPVMILALTSQSRTPGQIYDVAANIIQQQLSQVKGVGDVEIGGGSLPAVRAEVNPLTIARYGISFEDVRAALASANANRPKGTIDDGSRRLQVYTNDQSLEARDYRPLIIAHRNGAVVRLGDVADVQDGVEDVHNLGLFNGRPAIIVIISRQPGANIIDTVERIKKALPVVEAALPQDIKAEVAIDRTITIRASLQEVERTLIIAVGLVVLVVAFFLKSARATLVPAVAVTVSLLGTIGVMYLLGFSLNNISLMALTVATGFVVDDAIVVLENITRHLEAGMPRFQAALQGAREVGFTVLSISISLVAVFIPLLMMGGIIGRLFREFSVALATAVMISLVISLTTTPMICAYMLRPGGDAPSKTPRWWARASDFVFGGMSRAYGKALDWALDEGPVTLAILICTIALNVYLFTIIPKGFFPEQDTGLLNGGMQADQSSSFQISRQRMTRFVGTIRRDPAVQTIVGYVNGGRGGGGGGFAFLALKPRSERHDLGGAKDLMQRLRPKFSRVTGANMFLQAVQDVRVGGRQSNAAYQYTLEGPDITSLREWTVKLSEELKRSADLTDVNTDQEDHGLESFVNVNRDTAAQLGLSARDIDNTLYDAFGQRQVSTIYKAQNQYHVIMEAAPEFIQDPGALANIYVSTTSAQRALSQQLAASTFNGGTSLTNAVSVGPATARGGAGAGGGTAAAAGLPATPGAPVAPAPLTTSSSTSASTSTASATLTTPLAASSASLAAPSAGGGTAAAAQGPTTLNGPAAPPARGASTGVAISTSAETMAPLSAFSSWADGSQPRSVNHQDQSLAATISFNLAPGKSLSNATAEVAQAEAAIGMPATIHGSFQGTAKVFQDSLKNEPVLIAAAILAVYIVLGVLYESYVHPLTVISTLPSAGVGAVTALILFKTEFSIIAMIGIVLLIGIVKKNAIMIIDFALEAERSQGCTTREAIRQASMLRFRPIMMTTFAAMLGALPLAIGFGEGSELRRPLGIAIIGGLLVSQALTLITTPVVYLYLDRFRRRSPEERRLSRAGVADAVAEAGAPPEPA
jgi:multidrug efflux pump